MPVPEEIGRRAKGHDVTAKVRRALGKAGSVTLQSFAMLCTCYWQWRAEVAEDEARKKQEQ